MKKDILLALLPPWGDNSLAPLGIACIAASLKKSGYRVVKRDYNAVVYSDLILPNSDIFADTDNLTDETKYREVILPVLDRYLLAWTDDIIQSGPAIVGFTMYCTNKLTVKYAAEFIKERSSGIMIVVGGPETGKSDEYMTWGSIDFGVIGDGEETVALLVSALESPSPDLSGISGLVYKNTVTQEITRTGINANGNIDDLPYPDFDGISLSEYRWNSIPIEGSRGCINRCSFCGDVLLRKKFRCKSGKRLFDEILYFINRGHRAFSFMDSLVNGKISELEIFCDCVIDYTSANGNHDIIWGGNACFRKEMTPDILNKMKRAGCIFLNYGLESGSDDVLKMMNKRFSTDLAGELIRETSRAGINVNLFMLIGFPTETEVNFRETLHFILRHKDFINTVFAGEGCVICENSDLHVNPDKYGIYWEGGNSSARNDHNWSSGETTPLSRIRRVKMFVEYCNSLGIKSEDLLDKLNIRNNFR